MHNFKIIKAANPGTQKAELQSMSDCVPVNKVLSTQRTNPGTNVPVNKVLSTKVENVAVIAGSSMGDAILSIPLLRNIRNNYPDAEITVITGSATTGMPILESCPYKNSIIQIKNSSFIQRIKSIFKILKLKRKFTIIFLGAPMTKTKQRFAKLLKPEKIISASDDENMPVVENNMQTLKNAGLKTDNGYLELFYDLKKNKPENIVAIYAGRDTDIYRKLPAKKWKIIIDSIPEKYQIVFIGGNDCKETIGQIQNILKRKTKDISGTMSIKGTAQFLARCRLLITTNGGPMHLASAVGTPLIAINTSSKPMWRAWNPQNKNIAMIWGRQCETPCKHDNCDKKKAVCVESIDAEKVIQTVKPFLK